MAGPVRHTAVSTAEKAEAEDWQTKGLPGPQNGKSNGLCFKIKSKPGLGMEFSGRGLA